MAIEEKLRRKLQKKGANLALVHSTMADGNGVVQHPANGKGAFGVGRDEAHVCLQFGEIAVQMTPAEADDIADEIHMLAAEIRADQRGEKPDGAA